MAPQSNVLVRTLLLWVHDDRRRRTKSSNAEGMACSSAVVLFRSTRNRSVGQAGVCACTAGWMDADCARLAAGSEGRKTSWKVTSMKETKMDNCITCGGPPSHLAPLDCIRWLQAQRDSLADTNNTCCENLLAETTRLEQITLNDEWLRARIDEAHHYLCPEKCGTWQQRAQQLVEAAKGVAERLVEARANRSEPR